MNLLKVKSKFDAVKKFVTDVPDITNRKVIPPLNDIKIEYQIYVDRPGHRSEQYPEAYPQLIWYTRAEARSFKKLLKSSTRHMKARIIRREWEGGFIYSEEEVW